MTLVVFQTQPPPDGWERDRKDLHHLLPLELPDAVLGAGAIEALR